MSALSTEAGIVLAGVLEAIQRADEMQGVKDEHDYIALMDRIITEAHKRRSACIAAQVPQEAVDDPLDDPNYVGSRHHY